MGASFDELVDALQEQILEETREQYSEVVMDHWMNPRSPGPMNDPDGIGRLTGPCGDTMEIFLRVSSGRIAEARFMTDGCASTIACGSMITQLVKGKTIGEALKVSAADVIEALGSLPDSSIHCSVLAARTLQQAISNLLTSKEGDDRETGN